MFIDFLRLLLACGDTAALEHVYCWDQVQFDAFLQENTISDEQQAVLDAIREKLLLPPMEQPFAYLKELQAEFDYSRIKYTEDYYEWVPVEPKIPQWKVYFDGKFWGHHGLADRRDRWWSSCLFPLSAHPLIKVACFTMCSNLFIRLNYSLYLCL